MTKFSLALWLILFCGKVFADDIVMEVLPLQNRPANEIQPLLTPLLESNEQVIGNGFNLIVKTRRSRLQTLQRLIEKLDSPQHNLLITVMQSRSQTAAELNAQLAIQASNSTIAMHGMAADTRELDDKQSLQQIRILDGEAAHIEVGKQRPIEQSYVYQNAYGYPSISSNTQIQQATTGFAVTPRLLTDKQVVIDITPWTERFQTGGRMTTQTAQTSLRTQLGEWVEIASSGTSEQSQSNGINSFNHSTSDSQMRILVKVDKAD